jgi:hypothetical protein
MTAASTEYAAPGITRETCGGFPPLLRVKPSSVVNRARRSIQ